MESVIKLSIFPHKAGWGIAMKSLSQGAVSHFFPNLNPNDTIRVKSERLKFVNSQHIGEQWITKFYAMPLDEQLAKVGNKWVKALPPKEDMVIVNVQYYKVMQGMRQVLSTYDLKALVEYRKQPETYYIEKSVTRQLPVLKSDYEDWKAQGRFDEVIVQVKGIVGMMRNVEDIQRRKVVGKNGVSDRHSGYRTTTSVNFHKGR